MTITKVFGIGLSRTGTTSLCHAMKALGFSAVHCPGSLAQIDDHFFSNDTPISSRFEALDERYPNAKFIYTTRNIDQWALSCLRRFAKKGRIAAIHALSPELREWYDYGDSTLYGHDSLGLVTITKEELVAAYMRHDERVKAYFTDRASDLLVIDVTTPRAQPLAKLVAFLEQHGLVGMPHLNKISTSSFFGGESSSALSFVIPFGRLSV